MLLFSGIAVALILTGVINYFANFVGRSAVPQNSDAMVLLDEHAHPHVGATMILGLIIVAVVSFGMFWLLARRNGSSSVA
jgi:hypothetical protein